MKTSPIPDERTVNLRAIDVGFDLLVAEMEVALPPGHLRVLTDRKVYLGEASEVAKQMRADGWRVS